VQSIEYRAYQQLLTPDHLNAVVSDPHFEVTGELDY
jgi:hypothetical protein